MGAVGTRGWTVVDDVIDADMLERLQQDLTRAYSVCRAVQVANGVAESTDGTVHHLLAVEGAFLDFLGRLPLDGLLRSFFDGPYILNSYGGVLNQQGTASYVSRPHRDVRRFSRGLPVMMNVLFALDNFSLENGATHLLSGSHLEDAPPGEDEFFRTADRAVLRAGSALMFDANLWHAAGTNQTDSPRRALTLTFTPPWYKQQLDYCRLLGNPAIEQLSPRLQQVLGFRSRTPTSLDEWYRPRAERFYRPDQG
jgi:hypothetical protein